MEVISVKLPVECLLLAWDWSAEYLQLWLGVTSWNGVSCEGRDVRHVRVWHASCESVTCEVLGPTCIWCLVLPIEYLGRPCQKLNWLSSAGYWGVLFEYLYLDRHTFLFDKETMTWFYSVHPEFFLSILSWTKPTSYCWSVDWVLATSVKSLCKMWGWDLVSRILSKRSHRFLC